MDAAEEDSERIRAFGNHHQMNVVGHQAIRQDPDPSVRQIVGRSDKLGMAVTDREEHVLAVSAPLGDMIGQSREDAASVSRHG